MKFFDLHNDALTCGAKTVKGDIIYAVWTSRLSYYAAVNLLNTGVGKMLAVEDCAVFADNPRILEKYDLMYVGLTWNTYNGLAGGAYSTEGLSAKGVEMINFLNQNHIPVDTAHLGKSSFFDVVDKANKVLCSHTCFYDINNHPRNLTAAQISAIINSGGIVGLCFVGDFLGEPTVECVIRHIDWFLTRFGDKNLAIGTDFYGTSNLPQGLKSYDGMDSLVLAMIRQGYSDSTIRKVLYTNAATYFFDS
ncbi:MAG: hypothetical protein E7350_04760 [Clostridiales bacterium]|nr:hypothetical protein [Clostridiales bacterium]